MLDRIRYFQAVVRLNSFTEAAEECSISQSAISQQIKALEQELGFDLLVRKNRKFEVTPAGEHFYKKSLVLVADYDRLVQDSLRISKNDNSELRIGYLKGYSGSEIQTAVARFSEQFPDVTVHIISGNHEDLYDALRTEKVDLILNDQRRAFSDEYVNLSLIRVDCLVEIASRNPIAALKSVSPDELKNTPCILVASKNQRKTEQEYYQKIFGFKGVFLFAESVEEARLMVVQNNGFMPQAIKQVCDIFRSQNLIPCTACRYCTEQCPKNIAIPDLFACLNAKKQFNNWNTDYYYENIHTANGGKASDCIKCGKCEMIYPQHLEIRRLLTDVAREFDR